MKIAIASVMQESNSFAPGQSSLSDFQIEVGSELARVYQGTNTELGGFLEELEKLGFETLPLLSAWALPAGPVAESAFEGICELLLKQMQDAEFAGLLIALHGAWLNGSHHLADAEIVRRIRTKVKDGIPIVATLDMHANVRPALLEGLWGAVGYRTYPHVDMADTGRKAVRLMSKILKDRIRPTFFWLPIPFLAPPQAATTDSVPLKELFANLDESLREFGSVSSSFFCVQPWLDIEEMSSSLLVVAESRCPQIAEATRHLASRLWEQRSEFEVEWVSPESLLSKLEQFPPGPVIVSEGYDATTGGAPGDHPGLLQILLPHREKISACLFLVDPVAAQEAQRVGIGGEFHGNLGAGIDNRFAAPVRVNGRIRHLSDGVFTLRGQVFTGKMIDMGPTAVLELGRLDIVVASRAVMTIDPELFRSQGIEPRDRRVVAVKSPSLFRPGYKDMLAGVLYLDLPGVCRGHLREVPFRKLNRPIYPLDDFSWENSCEGIWL
jgi:microcystin degradation protein MlrC